MSIGLWLLVGLMAPPSAGIPQPERFPVYSASCQFVGADGRATSGVLAVTETEGARQINLQIASSVSGVPSSMQVISRPIAKASVSDGTYMFEETGNQKPTGGSLKIMLQTLGPLPRIVKTTVSEMPSLSSPTSMIFEEPKLFGLCERTAASPQELPQ